MRAAPIRSRDARAEVQTRGVRVDALLPPAPRRPAEDPVCTADGYVFDILNVVPYIKKFGKHPVTGQPLAIGDLVKLHFHKNADGEYHCPVLNKARAPAQPPPPPPALADGAAAAGQVFTESTHIVAVRTSGNVYCHDALAELNFKPKNWRDLLSDTPFTRKDVIVIQDPLNLSGRVLAQFDHVKKGIRRALARGARQGRRCWWDRRAPCTPGSEA